VAQGWSRQIRQPFLFPELLGFVFLLAMFMVLSTMGYITIPSPFCDLLGNRLNWFRICLRWFCPFYHRIHQCIVSQYFGNMCYYFQPFRKQIQDWLVVSNIFYFHPYLGKIPILTNIFQMGWNHQPEDYCPSSLPFARTGIFFNPRLSGLLWGPRWWILMHQF